MWSMPRRPARPVSWVYWPGVRSTCASPLNLTIFSSTTVRAGMLMPSARVSVAKTTLTKPRTNNCSTMCLNAGNSPAWCAANPRIQAVRTWRKFSTSRSSSGMPATPSSIICSISARSSGVVSSLRERRHWNSAPSQPAREKMNTIAGSMSWPWRAETTSGRPTGRTLSWRRERPLRERERKPLPSSKSRRPSSEEPASMRSMACSRLRLTRPPVPGSNSGNILRPTIMYWLSGTGRCSETMTSVSPRTASSHSPNSSELDTVADRPIRLTESSRLRMISSHTAPRSRSAR